MAQTSNPARKPPKTETIHGFNIRRWSDRGLNYWAVSDIGADVISFGVLCLDAGGSGRGRDRVLSLGE